MVSKHVTTYVKTSVFVAGYQRTVILRNIRSADGMRPSDDELAMILNETRNDNKHIRAMDIYLECVERTAVM